MPQERLPKQALLAKANGRRPVGRPRTKWTDYIEDVGWNRLGLRPSEMMEVMEAVRCGGLILSYCPRNPHGKTGNEERRRKKIDGNEFALTKTRVSILPTMFNLAIYRLANSVSIGF